jgi:ribose transport system permease protein
MMLVVLLGQIDLSVPWVLTVGGMMSTAAAGWDAPWNNLAIPFGIFCGFVMGFANGIGIAYLRVPSMIFTLGMNAVAQGLMVLRTGGFAPQDHATDTMHELATGRLILNIPNALFVWVAVGAATIFVLMRTTFGRAVYAIGNRERAAYLSGIATQRIMLLAFAASGGLSASAGVLLAGYSTKAYQSMGDPYLLPAVASVVLGGTNILGGRGSYVGTIAGVILITLLQSILSVMQIEEAGRQLIYGAVIIGMLLIYGRQRKQT